MGIFKRTIAKGEIIKAELINEILAELRRLGNMSGAGNITVQNGPYGYLICGQPSTRAIIQGQLIADLTAGSAASPSSADLEIYTPQNISDSNKAGTWTDTGNKQTIYNRTGISLSANAYAAAELRDGVWTLCDGDCTV